MSDALSSEKIAVPHTPILTSVSQHHGWVNVKESLSADPAAANNNLVIVENCGLAGSDCPLRLFKGDENLVGSASLNCCCGGLVTMANLHAHTHRLSKIFDGNQINPPRPQSA